MKTQRGFAFGIAATMLLGLGLLWTHTVPAGAQQAQGGIGGGGGFGGQGGGGFGGGGGVGGGFGQVMPGRPFMGVGQAAIAASGDSVYVLRGNTIFKLKAADLSIQAQKDLIPRVATPLGAVPNGGGQR